MMKMLIFLVRSLAKDTTWIERIHSPKYLTPIHSKGSKKLWIRQSGSSLLGDNYNLPTKGKVESPVCN